VLDRRAPMQLERRAIAGIPLSTKVDKKTEDFSLNPVSFTDAGTAVSGLMLKGKFKTGGAALGAGIF
jgi:hypothetical protein